MTKTFCDMCEEEMEGQITRFRLDGKCVDIQLLAITLGTKTDLCGACIRKIVNEGEAL